jgi:hypothetical protein
MTVQMKSYLNEGLFANISFLMQSNYKIIKIFITLSPPEILFCIKEENPREGEVRNGSFCFFGNRIGYSHARLSVLFDLNIVPNHSHFWPKGSF